MATQAPRVVDFEKREFVLRADFDLLDEQRCVWVSMRFLHGTVQGPGPPSEGDLVYLIDELGRGCPGTVDRVDGHYACVRPDWASFTGGALPSGVTRR